MRAAAWSAAVNHGAARDMLIEAIETADKSGLSRDSREYDPALVANIYDQRIRFVKALSAKTSDASRRRTFQNMVRNRFAQEPLVAQQWLEDGR